MNLSLIQPVLYFLVGLTVASFIGFSSYFLLRVAFEKAPEVLLILSVFYVIGLVFLSLFAMPLGLYLFLGFSALWSVATLIERAAYREQAAYRRQEVWIDTFLRFSFTTGVSVLFSCLVFVGSALFIEGLSLPSEQETGLLYGYCAGAFLSSSITPVFLWIWKTMQTRPGVDRHLQEGEKSR